MNETREKHPLRPLMKQVKKSFAEWRLEQNLVEKGDYIKPPSNNYVPYTKADGTKGSRIHIGFAAAEPPVATEDIRAFAEHLREHPEFDGTVIYKEFSDDGKKSHRYLLIEPAEGAAPVTDDPADDGRAAPLYGSYPTLSPVPALPAPPQLLRR